jgi:glucan phosphoethanolaminetransferase (alkaline phosphatase superfamily)
VQLYQTILEVIDLRSFSNLWFWIALAVLWSSASHFILGVPYDMVLRARRHGGEAEADLHDMVRINTNRILHISSTAGIWIVAFGTFVLTILAVLGIYYGVEFAQAVLCLFLPLMVIAGMSVRAARRIAAEKPASETLFRRLTVLRFTIQTLGIVSILITSMWGMWVNLRVAGF